MPDSPGRSDRQAIPIGLFLHYLLAECGVSTHTLAAYRSDLMRFDRWRKSEEPGPLASLNVQSLGRYVDALSRSGLAPSSICRHLASLSTFFRFMVDVGRVPENVGQVADCPGRVGSATNGPRACGGRAVAPLAQQRIAARASRPGRPRNPVCDWLPCLGSRRPASGRSGPEGWDGAVRRQRQQGTANPVGFARHPRTDRLPRE